MSGAPGGLFLYLYTDEDVTDRLAVLLRKSGYDAESAAGAGTLGFSDEEQLLFAACRGWTILTYNRRDFSVLARQWLTLGRDHAGIVLSRQYNKHQIGELFGQVCTLMDNVSVEEMWNTVRDLQSYR
jgi:uncharacterized protein with PIN domain